jgi:hypothetical protein
MRQSPIKNTNAFNSWKEIACYLGRGVRTVQRWEHELSLPVHRFDNNERGPVFAFKGELDTWLRRQAGQPMWGPRVAPDAAKSNLVVNNFAILDRSALLASKALQLMHEQRARTTRIAEQVERMASLLPGINRMAAHRNRFVETPTPTRVRKNGENHI